MHFQKTELEAERVGQGKDHLLNDLSVEASGIHGEGESMVPLVSVSQKIKNAWESILTCHANGKFLKFFNTRIVTSNFHTNDQVNESQKLTRSKGSVVGAIFLANRYVLSSQTFVSCRG